MSTKPPNDKADLDSYKLAENPGHLLRRTQQFGVVTFAKYAGRDLRPRQFALLISVYQNPGLHQVDYMPLVGMDRSTISDVVDRLEKRGLLERRKEDGDDRTANLYATDAGEAALEEALSGVQAQEAEIFKRLPAKLHAPFMQALKILASEEDGCAS